jgi:hypothetical protein
MRQSVETNSVWAKRREYPAGSRFAGLTLLT